MGVLQPCVIVKKSRSAVMTPLLVNTQSVDACQAKGKSLIGFQPAAAAVKK